MNKKKKILFVLLLPILLFSIDTKIDSLQQKMEHTEESVQKIELLIELSIEFTDVDTSKSFEFGNQAIELSNKLGTFKAEAYGNLGYINYLMGNDEISLKQLLNALTMIESENSKVRARLLKIIGFVYIHSHEYDRSLEYLDKSLNIFLELGLKPDISKVYYAIGNTYRHKEMFNESLEYYNKSLQIDKALNDTLEIAGTLYTIGSHYHVLAEYGKALETYFYCLKMYEKLDNRIGIADSYNAIGTVFQSIEDNDIALEYYNKHLEIQKETNNKLGISIAYNNIAIIYNDYKDYDKALEYYFIALKNDKELNNQEGIATIYNNLGIVYFKLKDYDKSLKYYQQSLSISKELHDGWAIANTSNNLADLYFDLNQYKKSFLYVDKAFEYAQNVDLKEIELESFLIYSKLYTKTNRYKKAFENYKHYTELKDTLFTTSIKKVAKIQRDLVEEKKEKENKLLRKDNRIKSLQLEKQKNLRYSLLIIIILVFFFLFVIFKRYHDNKKENILTIKKNKLITLQKEQLDNAMKDLEKLNINLEKKVDEIKIGRKRLKMLNKIIRHDLSNDFAVIKSAVNIFKDNSDKTMLNEIQKRVDRSIKTIVDYRNYESFIDSNADLDEIEVFEVASNFPIHFPMIKFSIEGKCKVFADDALGSVFSNLISNSIKHGKASQIDIDISSERNICTIKFIDNGSGISDEVKDKIFDEGFFYGKTGHTGIGLHIVKETIEHYGGSIFVLDNEPKGVIFVISLRKVIKK
ncbi:MAG: tetratricopeptide repeat-containing sensor histidine kinase [Candidatus Cloacimonetes bacterium]|nr:tetratricopeptide repeat-containing sensor histidine kinase [Candidatus Cloacimonadota bacterium]